MPEGSFSDEEQSDDWLVRTSSPHQHTKTSSDLTHFDTKDIFTVYSLSFRKRVAIRKSKNLMCIIGFDSLGNTAEFLLLEDYYLTPQIKINDQQHELPETDENLGQIQEFTSASTRPIEPSRATRTKADTCYTDQYYLSERVKISTSCYSNNPTESRSSMCQTCQKSFSRDISYGTPRHYLRTNK